MTSGASFKIIFLLWGLIGGDVSLVSTDTVLDRFSFIRFPESKILKLARLATSKGAADMSDITIIKILII